MKADMRITGYLESFKTLYANRFDVDLGDITDEIGKSDLFNLPVKRHRIQLPDKSIIGIEAVPLHGYGRIPRFSDTSVFTRREHTQYKAESKGDKWKKALYSKVVCRPLVDEKSHLAFETADLNRICLFYHLHERSKTSIKLSADSINGNTVWVKQDPLVRLVIDTCGYGVSRSENMLDALSKLHDEGQKIKTQLAFLNNEISNSHKYEERDAKTLIQAELAYLK